MSEKRESSDAYQTPFANLNTVGVCSQGESYSVAAPQENKSFLNSGEATSPASCQEMAVESTAPSTRKNPLRFSSVEFLPYFWTQALGAINDNIFKNIVSLLFVYQGLSLAGISAATMANICAALFILPYILFSGYAGVLAERYDEARVIVWTKLAEVVVMALAALGFMLNSASLLLLCVFLMGAQSTFYGPVKYSYLPSRLNKDDLTKANAWVEASTFIGILLGTLVAGLLVNGFGAALNYAPWWWSLWRLSGWFTPSKSRACLWRLPQINSHYTMFQKYRVLSNPCFKCETAQSRWSLFGSPFWA